MLQKWFACFFVLLLAQPGYTQRSDNGLIIQSTQLKGAPVYWQDNWPIEKKNTQHQKNLQKARQLYPYLNFTPDLNRCEGITPDQPIIFYQCQVNASHESNEMSVKIIAYVVTLTMLYHMHFTKDPRVIPTRYAGWQNVIFKEVLNPKDQIMFSYYFKGHLRQTLSAYLNGNMDAMSIQVQQFLKQVTKAMRIEYVPTHQLHPWRIRPAGSTTTVYLTDHWMMTVLNNMSKFHPDVYAEYVDGFLHNAHGPNLFDEKGFIKPELENLVSSHRKRLQTKSLAITQKKRTELINKLAKHSKTVGSISATTNKRKLIKGSALALFALAMGVVLYETNFHDYDQALGHQLDLEDFEDLSFVESQLNQHPWLAAGLAKHYDEIIDAVSQQ